MHPTTEVTTVTRTEALANAADALSQAMVAVDADYKRANVEIAHAWLALSRELQG